MAIGISALIGAALGLRLNVFVLIPTIILAGFATAVIQVASGHRAWSVVFTVVLVATTLQISYLIVSHGTRSVRETCPARKKYSCGAKYLGAHGGLGLDGEHLGTVDHTESADCIVLTGDDPKAGGKSHVISVEWVDHVDSKVHLNKPSRKAVLEGRIAA